MARIRNKVEVALDGVRKAWELGRKVRDECGMTAAPGKINELAVRYGLNADTIRKIRQIADPKGGYTKRELDALLRLARTHDMPLGVSHVAKFVTVPKAQRGEIQKRAIEGRWSRRRIQAEILHIQGRHEFKRGGRQPELPKSTDDFLLDLQSRCAYWHRLYLQLSEPATEESPKIQLSDLPKGVRQRLVTVRDAMNGLAAAIGVALGRRNTSRKRRR